MTITNTSTRPELCGQWALFSACSLSTPLLEMLSKKERSHSSMILNTQMYSKTSGGPSFSVVWQWLHLPPLTFLTPGLKDLIQFSGEYCSASCYATQHLWLLYSSCLWTEQGGSLKSSILHSVYTSPKETMLKTAEYILQRTQSASMPTSMIIYMTFISWHTLEAGGSKWWSWETPK